MRCRRRQRRMGSCRRSQVSVGLGVSTLRGAGLPIGEVLKEPGALQGSIHDLSGVAIDLVDLEDALGDIDANRCGLHGGTPGLAARSRSSRRGPTSSRQR